MEQRVNNGVNEMWMDVKGYEGLYKISSLGRFYNIKTSSFIETGVCRDVKRVALKDNSGKVKWFRVKDLLGKHFLKDWEEGCSIIQIDGDNSNLSLDNLCVIKENIKSIDKVDGNSSNNKDVVCQYYKTTDYSKFKFLRGNRDINKKNLQDVIRSMSKNFYIEPIKVNENMEIIDGQHRFTACKTLGLPVYYIIENGLGIKDVKNLNTIGKQWGNSDFLSSNMDEEVNPENYKTYQFINNLINEYSFINQESIINMVDIIRVGTKSTVIRSEFKKGTLLLSDVEKEIIKNCIVCLTDFGFKQCNKYFIRAFLKLYSVKGYNHDNMVKKIQNYGYKILDSSGKKIKSSLNVSEPIYCNALCDLYNTNNRGKKIFYSKDLGFNVR